MDLSEWPISLFLCSQTIAAKCVGARRIREKRLRSSSATFIDLPRQSRYEIVLVPSEPLAQAVEHLPFKQRVAGSNPARLISTSPSSSLAQDTGLSRRRHGFKSRRGRHATSLSAVAAKSRQFWHEHRTSFARSAPKSGQKLNAIPYTTVWLS